MSQSADAIEPTLTADAPLTSPTSPIASQELVSSPKRVRIAVPEKENIDAAEPSGVAEREAVRDALAAAAPVADATQKYKDPTARSRRKSWHVEHNEQGEPIEPTNVHHLIHQIVSHPGYDAWRALQHPSLPHMIGQSLVSKTIPKGNGDIEMLYKVWNKLYK